MTQSDDEETIQLAIKLLEESPIAYTLKNPYNHSTTKIYLFND